MERRHAFNISSAEGRQLRPTSQSELRNWTSCLLTGAYRAYFCSFCRHLTVSNHNNYWSIYYGMVLSQSSVIFRPILTEIKPRLWMIKAKWHSADHTVKKILMVQLMKRFLKLHDVGCLYRVCHCKDCNSIPYILVFICVKFNTVSTWLTVLYVFFVYCTKA